MFERLQIVSASVRGIVLGLLNPGTGEAVGLTGPGSEPTCIDVQVTEYVAGNERLELVTSLN